MELLGLDWHIWTTVILILGMFTTLLKTRIPADIVFLSVMGLLLITGCLSAEDALSGFSSATVVTVGVLFVVVAGLESTGVLQWVVKHLLGQPSSYSRAIIRLMLPVAVLSSLLSNTTIVALFISVVKMWAKKLGTAPSKLLIPLSYAAGMGGVCTLIGTPPNLIISGFYADATGQQLGIFSTTAIGLICLAVGIASIIAMQRLLPKRKAPEEELASDSNATTTELYVRANSHLVGQTLADIRMEEQCAEHCNLIGVIHFDGEVETVTASQNADIFLMGGDTLVFNGDRTYVLSLAGRFGMECSPMDKEIEPVQGKRTLLSAIIMLGMVALSAFGVIPLLNSCMIAALLMLLTRCCSIAQAKQSINWDVLMVFACSVSLGKAIDSTGLAQMLANNMISICGSNATLAFTIVCMLGTFLTEFVSNTACGAIMAPVAIKIAQLLGANPLTFCMGLMISVSSSFATPIGSPTHLMVYVPGGYRFSDFLRIGLPMNIIILATNVIASLLIFPL